MRTIEYNSEQPKLIIPEYGRNVQKLINEVIKIEDEKKREAAANQIVRLMSQISTQAKSTQELEAKLWRHLFIISDFKINVHPKGIEVSEEDSDHHKPQQIGYPRNVSKYRNYGIYIQDLIDKAIESQDKDKKHGFYSCIASYMKLAYMTWNRDPNTTDEVILEDLKMIVGDRDTIPDNLHITTVKITLPKNDKRSSNTKSGRGKKNKGQNRRKKRY